MDITGGRGYVLVHHRALDVGMTFPNWQVLVVAVVGFGLVLVLDVFDAGFIVRTQQPVGRWVQAWARRYPVLAFLLAAILGMMIGHFYWSTPPPCPPAAHGGVTQATVIDCRTGPKD